MRDVVQNVMRHSSILKMNREDDKEDDTDSVVSEKWLLEDETKSPVSDKEGRS
jgi:hypothetical protein